jgi:DNA-binding transcriptional ArsR family regulator
MIQLLEGQSNDSSYAANVALKQTKLDAFWACDQAFRVEVMGQLSNQERRLSIRQLHASVLGQHSDGSTLEHHYEHRPRQMQRRLPARDVAQLVLDYQAGVKIGDLVARYEVNQSTITQHIKRAGVRLRYPALSAEEVEEATKLYRSGLSLAVVGAHFGVDPSTIGRTLKIVGVKMRDRYGREST